jgi:protease YdgD
MRILLGALASVAFMSAAQAACPDWTQEPAFGSETVSAGFEPDPFYLELQSGGEVDLSSCTDANGPTGFSGYVAEAPDFDFTYENAGGSTLSFTAVSKDGKDLVLLINDPDQNWHFSDDEGFAHGPLITITNAPAGLYDIWVGTYSSGEISSENDAILLITERD